MIHTHVLIVSEELIDVLFRNGWDVRGKPLKIVGGYKNSPRVYIGPDLISFRLYGGEFIRPALPSIEEML